MTFNVRWKSFRTLFIFKYLKNRSVISIGLITKLLHIILFAQ